MLGTTFFSTSILSSFSAELATILTCVGLIGVAHAIDRHDVRTSLQHLQLHIVLNFIDDMLELSVVSERDIENVRCLSSTLC